MNQSWISVVAAGIGFLLFTGCATQPSTTPKDSKDPKPSYIHLRGDALIEPTQPTLGLVKKALFNIVAKPDGLLVNNTPMKDTKALERFLSKQDKPVLTVSTHKCVSSSMVSTLMSIAQSHTDVSIAFTSFGDISDPECKKP